MIKYFSLLLLSPILFSCVKYENGPSVSFRTKTKRLIGEWEAYSVNDTILTDYGFQLEIQEDGDILFTPAVSLNGVSMRQFNINGNWEWGDKKDKVYLNLNLESAYYLLSEFGGSELILTTRLKEEHEYSIYRLTNEEFWAKDEDNRLWRLKKIE